MKPFVLRVSVILGAIMILATGCVLFDESKATNPLMATLADKTTTSIRLRIVLPDDAQRDAGTPPVEPSVRANTATATVTGRLILINAGNRLQPTTVLTKTAQVDASGTASLRFDGVPVRTVIGEVVIDGGSINGWTEFHGGADLRDAPTVLDVSPKGSSGIPDLFARVLLQVAEDPDLVAVAPSDLVERLKRYWAENPGARSVGDAPILDWAVRTVLMPPSMTVLAVATDGRQVQGSAPGAATWTFLATQVEAMTGLGGFAFERVVKQGFSGKAFILGHDASRKAFLGRIDPGTGSCTAWLVSDGPCGPTVCRRDGTVIGGAALGGQSVVFRWASAGQSRLTTGGLAGFQQWARALGPTATTASQSTAPGDMPVEFIGVDPTGEGEVNCAVRNPTTQWSDLYRLHPITGEIISSRPGVQPGLWARPGDGAVTVGWRRVTGAVYYNLYSHTTDEISPATHTSKTVAGGTEATVTGLTNGQTYRFVVTSIDSQNRESSPSAILRATPKQSPFAYDPAAPVVTAPMNEDERAAILGRINGMLASAPHSSSGLDLGAVATGLSSMPELHDIRVTDRDVSARFIDGLPFTIVNTPVSGVFEDQTPTDPSIRAQVFDLGNPKERSDSPGNGPQRTKGFSGQVSLNPGKVIRLRRGMGTVFAQYLDDVAKLIDQARSQGTSFTIDDRPMSIANMKNIGPDTAVLVTHGHGGSYWFERASRDGLATWSEKTYGIYTSEYVKGKATTSNPNVFNPDALEHRDELYAGRVGIMCAINNKKSEFNELRNCAGWLVPWGTDTYSFEWHYAITQKFVERYFTLEGSNAIVVLGQCNGMHRDSTDFRNALFSKGASYVCGWDNPVHDPAMGRVSLYLFDRLLGTNKKFGTWWVPDSPLQAPWSPLELAAPIGNGGTEMARRGLSIDRENPHQQAEFKIAAHNLAEVRDVPILRPRITNIDMFTNTRLDGTFLAYGLFGKLPRVLLNGQEVRINTNSAGKILNCTIPDSFTPAPATLIVESEGIRSNPRRLVSWNATFTYHFAVHENFTASGESGSSDLSESAELRVTFVGDPTRGRALPYSSGVSEPPLSPSFRFETYSRKGGTLRSSISGTHDQERILNQGQQVIVTHSVTTSAAPIVVVNDPAAATGATFSCTLDPVRRRATFDFGAGSLVGARMTGTERTTFPNDPGRNSERPIDQEVYCSLQYVESATNDPTNPGIEAPWDPDTGVISAGRIEGTTPGAPGTWSIEWSEMLPSSRPADPNHAR